VIEALGGASVLCVDKMGTLTENQMQVARLWTGAVLTLVLTVPLLANLFRVIPPDLPLLCLALVVAGLSGGWFGVARSVSGLLPRSSAKPARLAPP
jgi:magnesium-transporting ATPase (P-type)